MTGEKAMLDFIKAQVNDSYQVKMKISQDNELLGLIKEISLKAIEVYRNGNRILIAGNGGSAADAQHIVGEIVNRFYFDRPGLSAMALSTDTSVITAIGNDYGYENIFSRQIQANGKKGDMFIGISTSGNSPNILRAFEECRRIGIISIGLTSKNGGRMVNECDYCIRVPSDETPRVQEAHIMIGHIICSIVEASIFGSGF